MKLPTDKRFKDLTGQRFGRLVVQSYAGKRRGHQQWLCRCDCGTVKRVDGSNLGVTTKSCGCLMRSTHVTHGLWSSPESDAFRQAKSRCNNANHPAFKNYGGRGIEFRLSGLDELISAIGRRPSSDYSLDRIEVNGHYEVGNIRWATREEQNNNTRQNRYLEVDGRSLTATAWSKLTGVNVATIKSRVDKQGWCGPCAVTIKPKSGVCPHIGAGRQ